MMTEKNAVVAAHGSVNKPMPLPVRPAPLRASLWRLLIDPVEIKTHYEGGQIELPDSVIEAQQYLRYIGQVIDIGPLAFTADQFRDHNGTLVQPCSVGDWIVYGRNTGADVFCQVDGDPGKVRSLRLINDDQVLGLAIDIEQIKIPLR
jgi:hypothetical protein